MADTSLFGRIGGYDTVVAVVDNLLPRLVGDERLGRFWAHRGTDGVARERQLLIDYLCVSAGGNMYYTGRDMATTHAGMAIGEEDWSNFRGHVAATFDHFAVGEPELGELLGFIDSLKSDIVEA